MLHSFIIIVTLIGLEGLLSADNALVLAVLVKHLPKKQRQRALLYGVVGAFVMRFLGLLAAVWIVQFWYLRAIGGGYLFYLALRHFIHHASSESSARSKDGPGFWRTVLMVEMMDAAFAIDSILVAVGLSESLWVIYTGGILGIIAMRFAAGGFLKVLERYPALEHTAYVLITWISVKLFLEAYPGFAESVLHQTSHLHLVPWLFWSVMGLIAVGGTVWAIYAKKEEQVEKTQE